MIPTPYEINRLEDEIADQLDEINNLVSQLRRSDAEYAELEELYRGLQEELRDWINASQDEESDLYEALNELDQAQERAERVEGMSASLRHQRNEQRERAEKAEAALKELKKALRVLGDEER